MEQKPPLPPFSKESAIQKIRMAEDAWNTRDPEKVALVYTDDTIWRNRSEFPKGREQVKEFLCRKWAKELNYRLIKELWAFTDSRIAVRFAYECHDDSGNWSRSFGNENWEFNENGFMMRRFASINDLPIKESNRKFFWPLGRRPDDHPELSDFGFQKFIFSRGLQIYLFHSHQHVSPKRIIALSSNTFQKFEILNKFRTAPDRLKITPWQFYEVSPESRNLLNDLFVD